MLRTTVTFSAVALAAVLCAPAGLSAGWGSYGSAEPDTHYDRDGGTMWADAPGGATHRVYFNVYAAQGPHNILAANSATLGSRLFGSPVYATFDALLGVWADCNHDGYVGLGDTGALEYAATASEAAGHHVDTDVCPPMADGPANNGTVHNGGGWITELIPIFPAGGITGDSWSGAESAHNYRLIVDPAAKMWGDRVEPRAPDFVPPAGCTQSSIIPLFGYQETSHTGGILTHLDCTDGNAPDGARNLAAGSDPTGTLAALPQPSTLYAPGGPADITTFGSDDSHQSAVSHEFDCGGYSVDEHHELVNDGTTGADVWANATVYQVGSPQVNPQGTAPATINETLEEGGPTLTGEDCDASDDFGHDFYGNSPIEGTGAGGVSASGKTSAELNFQMFQSPIGRGGCDATTIWDNVGFGPDPIPDDPALVPAATCGMPANAGLLEGDTATGLLLGGSSWWGTSQYLGSLPSGGDVGGANVNRDDFPPSATPDADPASWATFYAYVGASGVATPGGAGAYGGEWCGGNIGPGAPLSHGWDCDPADWYVDASTGGKLNNADTFGTVGDAFNLRDVECYDMTLVSGSSSLNPTGQDLGPRTAAPLTDPAHGCS